MKKSETMKVSENGLVERNFGTLYTTWENQKSRKL